MADILSAMPVRNGDVGLSEDELQVKTKSGTNLDVNINADAVGLALETGGNLATIAGDTTSIDGKLNSLGQKNMAGSVPVVLASDQSALPVTFSSLTPDIQYATATVAAGVSSTHTYSPAATQYLKKIIVSGSGQLKAEIQYGTTGSETTKVVAFSSKGNLTSIVIDFPDAVQITNAMSVKVIRTNKDNSSLDVYSTIFLGA